MPPDVEGATQRHRRAMLRDMKDFEPETPEDDEGADTVCGEPDDGTTLMGAVLPEFDIPADGPEADLGGATLYDVDEEELELRWSSPEVYAAQVAALDDPSEELRDTRVRLLATPLSTAAAQRALRNLGWRVRTSREFRQAVSNFQRGWALGPALHVDGDPGPKTAAALRASEAARRAGRGTASRHFSFKDFACKCGGRYSSCPRIWIHRATVISLEDTRRLYYPRGLTVVSGCRCASHNAATPGAARNSQHLYGTAVDIGYAVRDSTLASRRLWAGLGRSSTSHKVRHVDRRDASGHNATRGSTTRPTVWNYAK